MRLDFNPLTHEKPLFSSYTTPNSSLFKTWLHSIQYPVFASPRPDQKKVHSYTLVLAYPTMLLFRFPDFESIVLSFGGRGLAIILYICHRDTTGVRLHFFHPVWFSLVIFLISGELRRPETKYTLQCKENLFNLSRISMLHGKFSQSNKLK